MADRPAWPSAIDGWTWDRKDKTYDRETLFDHIDGGAEVYLAYNFQKAFVHRYLKTGRPDIVAEVYIMGSSEDAFGVFSLERQDPEAGIGQGSEFGGSLLRFWKGSIFVSVLGEGAGGKDIEAAVLGLGRALAASIKETGEPPRMLRYLPDLPSLPPRDRLCFVHSHILLNRCFFLSHTNLLKLGSDVQAVLARYSQGNTKIRVLIVGYPSEARAGSAFAGFRSAYMPDADRNNTVLTEDNTWTKSEPYQKFVIVVFGAPASIRCRSPYSSRCRQNKGGRFMNQRFPVTRRDFLKGTAGLIMAMGFGASLPAEAAAEDKARVVVIRNPKVLGPDEKVDGNILKSMLDEAVQTLLNEKDPLTAWQRLIKKTDVVGIKSNSWRYLPTPVEMEQAIRRRVLDLGIPEGSLAVDDRGVLNNPVFQKSTALINVRPIRTHHWAGVGSCLKNYIMFVPTPSAYHPEGCSDLGKIWTLPLVKGKTRLNILVALTPQFYGRGPNSIDRRYLWAYKGLIVGLDPVSVSAVGAELLRLKRISFFGEDRELDVQPIHITVADKKYHLGISDLNRIEIIKLGWMDQVLLGSRSFWP